MNEQQKPLLIGWAWANITPDQPIYLAGQLYGRVSQYVHDPITATALVIRQANEQVVMVSADMVSVPLLVLEKVCARLADCNGLDVARISLNVTHTHNSSLFGPEKRLEKNRKILGSDLMPEESVPDTILTGEPAAEYLAGKLVAIIRHAWEHAAPGGISGAQDYAAVAFNRRPVFAVDGQNQTKMYGDCSQASFKRFEGTSDHTADMLYTWDLSGQPTGVVVDIPCPSQVFELHQMITADYWAPTRSQIRERLGNIHILPLCGAAGDQNPLDLVRISKNNQRTLPLWNAQKGEVQRNLDMGEECRKIGERITEAVVRGYREARNTIDLYPVFRHKVLDMSLPLRQVSEADYLEAQAKIEQVKRQHRDGKRLTSDEVVMLFEPIGVVDRYLLQQETTQYRFKSHILRIGPAALATNPFELFCEYGMRIKARSRAAQTIIVQLANGNGGYLPTTDALAGGSYSSKPASTLCDPDGGDLLVEQTLDAINSMWD
ncbi:MAG: hypothetical protein M0P55_07830 [Clostridiales bacterium]|nr:hypothetical protein [Clostridiales bacterium]